MLNVRQTLERARKNYPYVALQISGRRVPTMSRAAWDLETCWYNLFVGFWSSHDAQEHRGTWVLPRNMAEGSSRDSH